MQGFLGGRVRLHHGDCLDALRALPDCSVDSVCCDPPYHLTSIVKRFGAEGAAPAQHGTDGAFARASRGFMGKTWDGGDIAFRPETWAEILRVLKPGGHLAAFGGTRSYHRLACAIEDAGFEIRDQIGWAYGTGFPKSHDVSKGIDRALGCERETVREGASGAGSQTVSSLGNGLNVNFAPRPITAPSSEAAKEWAGWGTALKPAWEPICLARKPLSEGTVAANVLAHGTGGINIDACRVETGDTTKRPAGRMTSAGIAGGSFASQEIGHREIVMQSGGSPLGRWPANIIHDGSAEVVAAFPDSAGAATPVCGHEPSETGQNGIYGRYARVASGPVRGDSGSAARFFYSAKASKRDRAGSKHPTVKPVALMRWLTRMVTPPGGTILDPFAGTGTTAEAAYREGFRCVLIEREAEYVADIERRLRALAVGGPDDEGEIEEAA